MRRWEKSRPRSRPSRRRGSKISKRSIGTDTADELTKTAGALGNMATAFAKFAIEVEKDLPILQGLIGALIGARVGGLFGPVGAWSARASAPSRRA